MDRHQKKIIEQLWDAEHEKALQNVLKKNKDLREMFELNPEKKEEYKFKILDSDFGYAPVRQSTVEQCASCGFCLVRVPFGKLPDNGNCLLYKDSESKPNEVLFDGATCEFYEKGDNKPLSLMVGLAVGDALGVPVEFKPRGSFHVENMQGYGTHSQPPGTWSDDTSLALALVDSLGTGELSLEDLGKRFVCWRDTGAYTPHGKVFDIGGATARAIERIKQGVRPEQAGGKGERDNGNGSLMRIAPITFYLFGIHSPAKRFDIVRRVSSLTHAHPISVTACFIYLEMLKYLRVGCTKEDSYEKLRQSLSGGFHFLQEDALQCFSRVLHTDIRSVPESDIKSSGYVVDTLEAAFWSFLTTDNYRDAVLRAVNLGDDTDTVGAVTGAMGELTYGLDAIPKEWRKQLAAYDEIRRITENMPRWEYIRSND